MPDLKDKNPEGSRGAKENPENSKGPEPSQRNLPKDLSLTGGKDWFFVSGENDKMLFFVENLWLKNTFFYLFDVQFSSENTSINCKYQFRKIVFKEPCVLATDLKVETEILIPDDYESKILSLCMQDFVQELSKPSTIPAEYFNKIRLARH